MKPNLLGNSGGSQPHDNMMPYLTVKLHHFPVRVFPSQT